jgi:2-hydroxyglutarate dehydrogenase
MEPDLGENVMCAMLSTESGIVDSHALMESLEADVTKVGEGEGQGSVALGTRVVRIDPYRGENGQFFFLLNIFPPVLIPPVFPFVGRESITGWVVQMITSGSTRPDSIMTRNLVLSAGLSCVGLLNPLLPADERLTAYYAKGQSVLLFDGF